MVSVRYCYALLPHEPSLKTTVDSLKQKMLKIEITNNVDGTKLELLLLPHQTPLPTHSVPYRHLPFPQLIAKHHPTRLPDPTYLVQLNILSEKNYKDQSSQWP